MNSKERMRLTMNGEKADRFPVMSQLALGHIYKNAKIGPVDYWWESKGIAEGFIRMAEMYQFDGILLNISGINPNNRQHITDVAIVGDGHIVKLDNGSEIFVPPNDDPRPLGASRDYNKCVDIDHIDLDAIKVIKSESELPSYFFDIMDYVIERKGKDLSIHGEVGTAFECFLLLFDSYEHGLMALVDDPDKSINIMKLLNEEVIVKATAQCNKEIDALKLSSPFASSSFISRSMYEAFVLPFEKEVIARVKAHFNIPCYIHTCGKIGDRLDLIVKTGINGIECLDPFPIGDVNLEKAIDEIGDKVFIKGNLDSVNELMNNTPEKVRQIAAERLRIAERCKKGYILSSACSISPLVPPENVYALYEAVSNYK